METLVHAVWRPAHGLAESSPCVLSSYTAGPDQSTQPAFGRALLKLLLLRRHMLVPVNLPYFRSSSAFCQSYHLRSGFIRIPQQHSCLFFRMASRTSCCQMPGFQFPASQGKSAAMRPASLTATRFPGFPNLDLKQGILLPTINHHPVSSASLGCDIQDARHMSPSL